MYNYTAEDRFETPEKYFYAKCDSADYIEQWKSCRSSYLKKLNDFAATTTSPDVNQEKHILQENYIDTYNSLRAINDKNYKVKKASHLNLELLFFLKKFEISKRLYSYYNHTFKPISGSNYRNYDIYLEFGKCIVLKRNNYQYISTLCKLIDSMTSINPALYTHSQRKTLIDLINKELELIDNIAL